MKEFVITEDTNGIRLDKFLAKILSNAGTGFIYKMIRKKSIILNQKKAKGDEHLKTGDVVKIFLSDETFLKFSHNENNSKTGILVPSDSTFDIKDCIIYEDDNILLVNKPAGILSQKKDAKDCSLNEYCLNYLLNSGSIPDTALTLYKPSVLNRLDRNTSGIVIVAKNYQAAACISEALRLRTIEKYYKCICYGNINESNTEECFLVKDNATNKVSISKEARTESSKIITAYKPIRHNGNLTELEVHLMTGKSHQIRAYLSYICHPIIGDTKYGNRNANSFYYNKYGVDHQLLHAYRIHMPKFSGKLATLSDKEFIVNPPKMFDVLMGRKNANME